MGSRARVSGQHGREDVSSSNSNNNNMGCVHATTILTNEDLEFIAKNTALSKVQVESRYQNFLKFHPDGRLSRKSFHSMMKECYPGADTEKLERHIFRMYDTNKDGTITLKELQKIVRDLFLLINETNADKASQEVLVKTAFNEMDENHDGKISQSEFVEACMAQKKFSTMLTLKIIDVFITEEAHGRASVTQRPPSLASIEKTK